MKKRIHRRRHISRKGRGLKRNRAGVMALAICCSVLAGYVTANYVIGPALGIETQPVFFDLKNEKKNDNFEDKSIEKSKENKSVIEDSIEMHNESGFALQYGSFSAREGAMQYKAELERKGIQVRIIEKDGSYKVIGDVFDTKEEAKKHKNLSGAGKDIFITEIP